MVVSSGDEAVIVIVDVIVAGHEDSISTGRNGMRMRMRMKMGNELSLSSNTNRTRIGAREMPRMQ